MVDAGLVLEGGGMKGVYTAGVLDFFLDKELLFKNIYGVSAGACVMSSYVSRQRGRAYEVMVDYLKDKHYMGAYSLLTTGDIFNATMNFSLVPRYLNPFDFEAFNGFEGNAYAVVTNIDSGEAEYIKISDMQAQSEYIRASSSLPLVSRNVCIDGKLYLDGGIADSIPLKQSIKDGNHKNVVVMTKPAGYVRKPEKNLPLIKARYLRHPKVYELMKNRTQAYNETVEYIEEAAESGKIILIRPSYTESIGRLEKDESKLKRLYEAGYHDAEASFEKMKSYFTSDAQL